MSVAANADGLALAHVRAQLATVDGPDNGEWTVDLASLGTQVRAYVLEQVTPDMSPWVFAAPWASNVRTGVSAQKEGFVEVHVHGIVRTDENRYPGLTAESLTTALVTDIRKAIESAPSLAELCGWLEEIPLEVLYLDPENDAWGYCLLRVRYAINGTLGQ